MGVRCLGAIVHMSMAGIEVMLMDDTDFLFSWWRAWR
jgi:hypothetical protein